MGERAVLLLHGQPGSADDFRGVSRAIGSRAHTVAIDRPGWNGHGSPTDLAGNARAALAALAARGVRRATVVGHSLGGAVAAWLAAEHPERVSALVLAAPSANRASLNRLDHLLATPLLGPTLAALGPAGAGVALQADPMRRRISTELGLDEEYLGRAGAALLRPATWRVFGFEQRMLIRELPALERRLAAISAPTTVVSGTADRIVTPSSARRLAAQIRGGELVQLPGAEHLLPQQRPAELAEIIVGAIGSA
jgi:pimeloyl-ACP methyl ester carboxylesterase